MVRVLYFVCAIVGLKTRMFDICENIRFEERHAVELIKDISLVFFESRLRCALERKGSHFYTSPLLPVSYSSLPTFELP